MANLPLVAASHSRTKKISLFTLFQIFLLFNVFLSLGHAGETICRVCQRKISHRVSFVLEFRDGSRIKACCPGCAIHRQGQGKLKVKTVFATDYISGKPLKAEAAIFIEDSDLNFCKNTAKALPQSKIPMEKGWDHCLPSLVAFEKPNDARKFQQRHGGRLLSYEEIIRDRQKLSLSFSMK